MSDPRWTDRTPKHQAMVAKVEAQMHPQITTAGEVDALPVGSIVLDWRGDAWQRVEDDSKHPWCRVGDDTAWSGHVIVDDGPARVVHRSALGDV